MTYVPGAQCSTHGLGPEHCDRLRALGNFRDSDGWLAATCETDFVAVELEDLGLVRTGHHRDHGDTVLTRRGEAMAAFLMDACAGD